MKKLLRNYYTQIEDSTYSLVINIYLSALCISSVKYCKLGCRM